MKFNIYEIITTMLFLHVVADYTLQGWLANAKQKDWYYITQGDYNLYYCENKISTRYEDFKEE